MTKKMILLFSHQLSEEQMQIAKDQFDVEEFIYLSSELQSLWSNIDPALESLKQYLKPITNYLTLILQKDDIVLVQGDFGATYLMVEHVLKSNAKAFYATTQRSIKEYRDPQGKMIKKSIFEFERFREYGF